MLLRTRDAARVLAVSQSQIAIWARSGLLHPIRLPGVRAVRFSANEIGRIVRELELEAGVGADGPSREAA